MVLGDLLSTHLNFIRNALWDILLGIRYFQLGIVINGMIGFYFFKFAQSIEEFKIYLSSVKSGHVWSFLQAGKIDLYYPLEIPRFCPTTGEKKICLVLFTIINPSLIKADRSKWQDIGLVLFCKFFIDHNWIGPLKKQKIELDQYLGHRNLIRLYNNTYILMLPWFICFV